MEIRRALVPASFRIVVIMVGAFLVIAGVAKATFPDSTTAAIGDFVSREFAEQFVRGLVVAEILLGAWVISGVLPRLSLALSGLLAMGFLAWHAWISSQEIETDCGCGFERLPLIRPVVQAGAWTPAGILLVGSIIGWLGQASLRGGGDAATRTGAIEERE